MDKKIITVIISTTIVAGGVSFYFGIKYDQNQTAVARTAARAQFGGAEGIRGARGGVGAGGGFTAGEVIAKDEKSITIKLRDGGSKIVFLSGGTEVTKSSQGSAQDILVGAQINANGITNADGSVTAQMIQIRPLINNQ